MPTGGLFLSRHLEQKVRNVLMRRHRLLPFYGGNLIPTPTDIQPGVREIVQDEVLTFGDALETGMDGDDFPLVEINARENRYRVFMPKAGYSVKYQEELATNVARGNGIQYNPTDVRADAVVRVLEEQVNKLAAVGSPTLSVTGMLNNAGVTPVVSSFDPFSNTSTADDIADWFLGLIGDIFISSNNVEYPNTALISSSLHELMARRRMPDGSETILSFIMNTQRSRSSLLPGQRLENIVPLVECGATYLEANGVESGGANVDRIVLYPRDPQVVERHMMTGAIAAMPEDWAIVKSNGTKVYGFYSFVSQVMINYPGALSYIKHAKEA